MRMFADVFDGLAELGLVADGEVVALLADQDLGEGFAADGGFDCVLNVGDVDAEAVGGGAIDVEIHVGLAADLEGAEVGDAGDLAHYVLNFVGFGFESLQVGAEEFDGEFTFHAADGFFHVVGNGLGEIPVDAGKLLELFVHGGDEFVFLAVELAAPFFAGVQVDEKFGVVETAGVAAVVGAADLADDLGDFREIGENEARFLGHGDAGGGTGAGGERAAHPDGAFIEMRKKFGADDAAGGHEDHERQREQTHAEGELQVIEAPVENASVGAVEPLQDRVAPFFDSGAEQDAAQHGCDEQSEDQCAEQGEGDGPGHGAEEAAFDALQGEDGQIGNNDDDAGEENRALHFMGRDGDGLHEGFLGVAEGGVAKDVFDHHHRSVDDHAEVESAQRQQVRGNLAQVEQDGGEEQREGNGDGDDERAAHVAEKEEQNQRDQQHAVGQIAQDGVGGVVHEFAAVEMGDELHALRQQSGFAIGAVQLVDLLMKRFEGGFGDGALAEQDDAFDHVVIVEDGAVFFADGLAQLAEANFGRLHDIAEIADADGSSVLHFDDGGGDVVGGLHEADSADVQGLLAALDESAAGVDVVGDQRVLDLRQRQAVGDQFAGIELHLIFAGRAAEGIHVDDVRDRLQLVDHDPVVQRFQFHHVIFRIGAGERVEHDLAGGAVVRADAGVHVRRQRDLSAGGRALPGGR